MIMSQHLQWGEQNWGAVYAKNLLSRFRTIYPWAWHQRAAGSPKNLLTPDSSLWVLAQVVLSS